MALALVTSVLGATGCETESTSSTEPKKTKKSKSKKGAKKSAASASASAPAKSADGSVPAPQPGEVPTWKVGAWSKYKTTTGETTWALLEIKGEDFLIDASVRGRLSLDVQALVNVPDRGDSRTSRIKELKYRMGGGAVKTMTGAGLAGQAKLYENLIKAHMPPKFAGMPQEDVTVKAGTFRGCYKWTSKETFMGMTTESTIWSHPAVPAPSMVRSETKEGQTFELIAYGATGAKPSF